MGTATAADVSTSADRASTVASVSPDARGKCRSGFGILDPQFIPSVSSPAAESSGAADVLCPRDRSKRTFSTVTVYGSSGEPGTTSFLVEVLANCEGEPCGDEPPRCSSMGVAETSGGGEGERTVINLDTKCTAKRGVNWVQVQAVIDGRYWFWQTTSDVVGRFAADWKEGGAFGTGCTVYQNGRNLESCIPTGDPDGQTDFTLKLTR